MKQTKVPSAEPSSVPDEPIAENETAPGELESDARVASVSGSEAEALGIPPILLEGDEPGSAQRRGQPPRFADTAAGPTPQIQPAPSKLPSSYGTGRLRLIARDPGSLYAHWDLTEEQRSRHAELSVDQQLRLRVHRDGLDGPLVTELAVNRESNHGFVEVGAGGIRYVAELGYQPQSGAWQGIAASEPVLTPSPTTSSQEPVEFGMLKFGGPANLGGEAGEELPTMPEPESSKTAAPTLERQFPLPPPLGPISVQASGPPESTSPAWVEGEDVSPQAEQPISTRLPRGTGPGLRFGIVPAPTGEWTEAQEGALAELIGRSLLRRQWVGSAEIEELIRGESRILPLSELAALQPGGKPVSSAELGQTPPERPGFWLNVNAELVVYGATQPDAHVTLGGQPVQLRPDGSFSCRFALPDGFYQLAVAATSARAEMCQAQLDFSRSTRYSSSAGSEPQDPALKPPLAT